MNVVDVHKRINDLAEERGLTPYELAKRAGMAQSSLYNMFERGTMPKIETLDRLCKGMDIDMSDFFVIWSKPRAGGYMTEKDALLVEVNHDLTEWNQDHLLVYAKGWKTAQTKDEK